MIQPARVLPSNAPPLDNDTASSTRILQEHSGNRQYDYSYADPSEHKYSGSSLTENTCTGHIPVHQAQHIYHQTALERNQYRYGYPRHHGHFPDPASREKEARNLYKRFRASDQYIKYRNRQQRDEKSQERIWPDRLELAFFQALVKWPPMGRRKIPRKDKLRGRNELIADHIQELTGELRTRKQVSSHIQVLKPFVEHDPQIMRFLSKDDIAGQHLGRFHHGGRASSSYEARRASSYAAAAPAQSARSFAPPTSGIDIRSLSKIKDVLEVFEPSEFSMFVQRKYGESEVERLHTYTHSLVEPLQPDRQLPDWASLEENFPLLHALHRRGSLDCNILLAEASLAFPTDNFKDKDGTALPGVELGISFLCSSRHLPAHAQVHCQNTFYKDGHLLREHSGTTKVQLTQSEDGTGVETQLKFGSTFWARTLAFLATKLNNPPAVDSTKDPREDVSEHIKGITASQEIIIMTDTGPERLLIMHWKFRLSRGEQGRAYWMRLLHPVQLSSTEYPEPKDERVDSVYDYGMPLTEPTSQVQPALQSPFEYDSGTGSATTALTASSTWQSIDAGVNTAPNSALEWTEGDDNAFDFGSGNINISYDPSLDFGTFDSSAFNFDTMADFAADPALQDYTQQPQDYSQSQQDFSQHTDFSSTDWYAVDSQQSVTGASFPGLLTEHAQTFDGYGYDQAYNVGGPTEGQAYGGAGREGKEEDPLIALATASFMSGGNGSVHGLPMPNEEHQTQ